MAFNAISSDSTHFPSLVRVLNIHFPRELRQISVPIRIYPNTIIKCFIYPLYVAIEIKGKILFFASNKTDSSRVLFCDWIS